MPSMTKLKKSLKGKEGKSREGRYYETKANSKAGRLKKGWGSSFSGRRGRENIKIVQPIRN
jgi:hypothetical protein